MGRKIMFGVDAAMMVVTVFYFDGPVFVQEPLRVVEIIVMAALAIASTFMHLWDL